MADSKIQFPVDADVAAWFRDAAKEQNLTQTQFFDVMRERFAAASLASEHPDHAGAIAAFQGLAAQMEDLFSGLVVTADAAAAQARKDSEAELKLLKADITEARARIVELEADVDAAYKAEQVANDAAAKAAREIESLRSRVGIADDAAKRLESLRDELEAEKDAKAEAQGAAHLAEMECERLRGELESVKQQLARADETSRMLHSLLMSRGGTSEVESDSE